MTIENYTTYTNQELLNILYGFNVRIDQLTLFLKHHHPRILDEFKSRTSKLNKHFESRNKNVPTQARLYFLEHDLCEHPTCSHPNCHNTVGWDCVHGEFKKYCSTKCMSSDKRTIEKRKLTNIRKYGAEHPMKSKEIQQKAIKTCLLKYGVEHASQSIQCKEKSKQTNIERLGVQYPSQSTQVKQKCIETSLRNYGTTHPMKSSEVKTTLKNSMVEKYGVENPFQLEDVKNKIRQTNLNKFGVEYASQSEQFKSNVVNSCMSRYGVSNVSKLDEVKSKSRETCLGRYGVDNYSKTTEFHQKCSKPYTNSKYPEMTFGSSWEFQLYDFLTEHHIEFEYQPSISFEYEYDGVKHTYHPDFKVGELIVEIKGDQFFRLNESSGQEEMYCPYKYDDWSDEQYAYECGKYEAKHQCMKNNDVLILRNQNIKNLNIQMFIN